MPWRHLTAMMDGHQPAEHPVVTDARKAARSPSAGRPRRRRDSCGSTLGCSDRCPDRGAASNRARRRRRSGRPEYTVRTSGFDGRLKSSDSAWPPGFSTRSDLVDGARPDPERSAGRSRSSRCRTTRPGTASACMSPTRNAAGAPSRRLAAARARSSAGVMSRPTTCAPRDAKRERDVAGAGREIQRRGAGERRREIDAAGASSGGPAVGEHDRDEIVTIGDRREQRPDVAPLPIGGGDAIVRSRHRDSLDNIAACSRRAPSRTT